MRARLLVLALMTLAYILGTLTAGSFPAVQSQSTSSRFVHVGTDGPFRIWKDTRTNQCFIVTTPYYAMLSVGAC